MRVFHVASLPRFGHRGWLGSLQWLHHSPLLRRPLSWTSARHRAFIPVISLQMPPYDRDTEHAWFVVPVFNILEQVICTCSDAFIVRIYFRWNHQCAYNDMNYHKIIASQGLFHGGHVGFTPYLTQRTDTIRLPSYSPYQKTYNSRFYNIFLENR